MFRNVASKAPARPYDDKPPIPSEEKPPDSIEKNEEQPPEEEGAKGGFYKARRKDKTYIFAYITSHPMYKGAEAVFAIWLTLAHANDMHVLSSKDFEIWYTFNLTTPVVYMMARLSAVVFKRRWVPWMVDVIFMIIYSLNYVFVFLFLLSEIEGLEPFHEAFFPKQRTWLRPGMVFSRMIIAFFLCVLLVIDNVNVFALKDKIPVKTVKY